MTNEYLDETIPHQWRLLNAALEAENKAFFIKSQSEKYKAIAKRLTDYYKRKYKK